VAAGTGGNSPSPDGAVSEEFFLHIGTVFSGVDGVAAGFEWRGAILYAER